MTKKEKQDQEKVQETEVFKQEKQGEVIITTSEPRPKKKGKKTLITTRDLPTWLENYHGKKEKSK